MRVTFRNLGTIKKTELDVRPMTVIIGPNNTSKTYVAYSIHGLWNSLQGPDWRIPPLGFREQRRGFSTSTSDLMTGYKNAVKWRIDSFCSELTSFFQDTSLRCFSETRFDIDFDQSTITNLFDRDEPVDIGGGMMARLSKDMLVVSSNVPRVAAETRVVDFIVSRLFPWPFLLPAERNALIITYKLLANRRFKLLREQQRGLIGRRRLPPHQMALLREQGDLRYPTPIEDFLDFLIDIELNLPESADAGRKPFRALADDIESKIQANNKTILVPTAFGGREVKVDVRDGLRIDLYNASSSIKQLAPLLLYLRYRAAPNQLLIIDEPEMNLHPEGQAKLLEALAILVNLGVHVLITTHSPYFMAHLNNLVAGDTKRPAVRKRQAQSLYMTDPRAFLSMDQVSAYEMRDNQLCSLKDEAYGIRWDTLSDVSVELQQRFFAIQEAGQARRGKKK